MKDKVARLAVLHGILLNVTFQPKNIFFYTHPTQTMQIIFTSAVFLCIFLLRRYLFFRDYDIWFLFVVNRWSFLLRASSVFRCKPKAVWSGALQWCWRLLILHVFHQSLPFQDFFRNAALHFRHFSACIVPLWSCLQSFNLHFQFLPLLANAF